MVMNPDIIVPSMGFEKAWCCEYVASERNVQDERERVSGRIPELCKALGVGPGSHSSTVAA